MFLWDQEEGVICLLVTTSRSNVSARMNMEMAVRSKEITKFKQQKDKYLRCEKKAMLHCEILRRVYECTD